MFFYFLIFLFIAGFGAVYRYQLTSKSRWLYCFLLFFLILLAAFRAEGVDNDMVNYLATINNNWGVAEPSFFWISYIGKDLLGSPQWVFVIYAVLALVLRFTAYRRLSPYLFMTIAIYFATNFVTHEMNQIRSAVGFGFMLWAVYFWFHPMGRRFWLAVLMMSCASFFHFSFLIPFLVIFFIKDSPDRLGLYLLLIPLAYLCHFAGLTPLSMLSNLGGGYIASKIAFYQTYGIDIVVSVNVFSILVCVKLVLIAMLYIYRDLIASKIPLFYFYLKLYILGLFMLLFFSTIPGAAFRISDLLWFVEPLLLPGLVFAFRPRWLAISILLILCLYWVWLNYVSSDFIRPYQFNFSL